MLGLARGHEIGRDAEGFFARPRNTTKGPAKELRDLTATARKAMKGAIGTEEWMDAWAAQPRATWRICRPSLFVPGTRTMDQGKLLGTYSASGFTLVVPKPDAVLPALVAQIDRMKRATGNKKKRKSDEAAREVITAVRTAYKALTGRPGGRTVPADGKPGPLVRLGRDIDKLFGTKVFPKVDSRRLKKNFGDKKPFRRPDK
jgi:hypothetical protein